MKILSGSEALELGIGSPGAKSRTKWPFKDMTPGDCVIVDIGEHPNCQIIAHAFGRTKGWKFSTKKIDANKVAIFRIS